MLATSTVQAELLCELVAEDEESLVHRRKFFHQIQLLAPCDAGAGEMSAGLRALMGRASGPFYLLTLDVGLVCLRTSATVAH